VKIVKWNQLCYKTIDFWRQQNQSIFGSSILRRDLGFHREMTGLEGGVYLYHRMTPPTNLGHSWVIFEGWSQILPSTKLFRHEFEQGCSAMATQKLEEKVQQHDAVVESSKTGCRSQSRARGKAYEQVPALICDTYGIGVADAGRLRKLPFRGVILLIESKITPPNIWGKNLKFLT